LSRPFFPALLNHLQNEGTYSDMKIFLDGKLVDEKAAKISVFDHGLLYGDGVFEGIRIYNSRVFKLEEHIDRLFYSAHAIMLKIPMSKAKIIEATIKTCAANKLKEGYIRLVVTRGVGNLGLSPWNCLRPSVIIIADKIKLYPDEYYQKGLKLITVPTRRLSPAALSPEVKSLNYLNNILAKIEARNGGCEEAILLNNEGYIAECTGDNIFVVHGGKLFTPLSAMGALKGITRRVIMDMAKEFGVSLVETHLTRYDVFNAEEMFLTGTGAEIVPVREVDARMIGNGKPGPITRRFIKAYKELTNREGTAIYPNS